MDTERTLVPARRFGWSSLSRHAKLQIAGLLGIALYFIYRSIAINHEFRMPISMFIGVALVLAALVATGLRWTPLLAVIGATPLLAGNRHRLFEPEQTGEFLAALFITAMVILVIVGGVRATRENYRRPRPAPR